MSYENPIQVLSFTAGEDLRTSQFCAVKIHTDGTVKVAGAGDGAIGILQNKPNQGEIASVMVSGVSLAKFGEAIGNAGVNLKVGAGGKLVNASGADDKIIGVSLEACSGDGEVHSVALLGRAYCATGYVPNSVISIPIDLGLIETETATVVEGVTIGYGGTISKINLIMTEAGEKEDGGTKADLTLKLRIGNNDVTGGAVQVTDTTGAYGKVLTATPSGANILQADSVLKVLATVAKTEDELHTFKSGKAVLLITLT